MQPKQRAVALRYKPENDSAPKVVASGQGLVAQRIIDKAEDAGVTVYKDEKLVEELYNINLGENIPAELYEVVAQVLIFISDIDRLEGYKNKE